MIKDRRSMLLLGALVAVVLASFLMLVVFRPRHPDTPRQFAPTSKPTTNPGRWAPK